MDGRRQKPVTVAALAINDRRIAFDDVRLCQERVTDQPADASTAGACSSPVQHSASSSVDNCYRDQAVTNAAQLADLLSGADVPVASPSA